MLYIFDMGGVVTTTAGDNLFKSIADYLNIDVDYFLRLAKEDNLLEKLDKGFLTAKEFWKIFSEKSGILVSSDLFRLLFHPVLNKETVSIINELKSCGNRVICATNTIDSHYDNHLARGDYSYFDITYSSIHMGLVKPDPEFYKMVLKCEKCEPKNAFFTDDKLENIETAESLGINTYHFVNASGLKNAILKLKKD